MRRAAGPFLAFAVGCLLCSCVRLDPEAARASSSYSRYLKGLWSGRLGDAREAARFYSSAHRADAQASAPHQQLGFYYIGQKDYENAAKEFETVVRLSPDEDNARYVLALLYAQLNDYKKAIAQYQHLLQRTGDTRAQNIQLRRILSQLYFLDKDLDKVSVQCAEILKLDAADAWGLYMKAVLDNEQGRTQEAIAGFQEVLKYHPEMAEAMNSLAYLYAEQGIELEKALVLIEKALEFDPENGAYLDTAGWIYFKMGDNETALLYLRKASKILLDPVIRDHLKEVEKKK